MIDPKAVDLASLPWLPLSERSAFPRQPAIYFAIDSTEKVQYIGISKDPKQRWSRHHRYEQLRSAGKVRIAYLFVEDVALLKSIEAALIAWFHPPLNVIGIPSCKVETEVLPDMESVTGQRGRTGTHKNRSNQWLKGTAQRERVDKVVAFKPKVEVYALIQEDMERLGMNQTEWLDMVVKKHFAIQPLD